MYNFKCNVSLYRRHYKCVFVSFTSCAIYNRIVFLPSSNRSWRCFNRLRVLRDVGPALKPKPRLYAKMCHNKNGLVYACINHSKSV